MQVLLIALIGLLATVAPLYAVVGGAAEVPAATTQPEVMLVGSGGNFCTGTLIASNIILSAAHCIAAATDYKLVEMGSDRQPVFRNIVGIVRHPQFSLKTMLAHRATADVALLKLETSLSRTPAVLLPPRSRVVPGERFVLRGYGVSIRGEGNSAGRLRTATLVATGQPGNLQLRLFDPKSAGKTPGMGACTGDSGGPVYQETPSGLAILGVVSWSTAPNNEDGCGGLTGVTPLELYRTWITDQAARMGSSLGR
jgi:secreted trypsin-like serine protease